MSRDDDRSDFEDLCNEDGPPAFCPSCEGRGVLSEVEYDRHERAWLCQADSCDYTWGLVDDGPISDRERL